MILRDLTHITATVSSAGDTVIHIPEPGKHLRVFWIYAINDPDSTASPLISVKLGGVEKYRVWVISKIQMMTGPVDGALVVNLSMAASVAFNALLEEF